MNRARRLVVGDTVALVNPVGMPPERFRRFISHMGRYLREEGFIVRECLAPEQADAKELAQRFTDTWLDPDVKAVFPICGGDRIFEVMEHLDPAVLAPKSLIFCGSSTMSALSLWLHQRAGIVTFFGPHLPFIHTYAPQRENEFSVQSFWDMVMWKKGKANKISSVHEKHHFFSVRDESKGKIRISNIYHEPDRIVDERRRDAKFHSFVNDSVSGTTFCITIGAFLELSRRGWLSSSRGSIIFTETMDWTLDQVRVAFQELAKADALNGARALFLTTLTERTDRKECLYPELRDQKKIRELCEFLRGLLGLPIFYGFPLGHGAYKLTMPQGVACVVDPVDGSVSLFEPPVQ